MIDSQFWQGKKVFITGHSGFKGSWLTLWLNELGADLTGYSLPAPTDPSLFEVLKIKDLCHHISGDVRDFSLLQESLKNSQAEIIFHLAAQPLVRRSYRDPLETYSTNVMGVVNLLELVKTSSSVKSCVIVTSDKCYHNENLSRSYHEHDKLGGDDPYSSSKACADIITQTYVKSFLENKSPIGVASARAGNVIGGGDFAEDRLIPDVYRSIIGQTELKIRYPQAIRPWQHVLVSLSGYLRLAQVLYENPCKFSGAFNFGPDEIDSITVESLVNNFLNLWPSNIPFVFDYLKKPREAGLLRLDISKAKSQLNWKPTWNLDVGLQNTINWYQAYEKNMDIRSFSINQINQFVKATIK